MPDITDTNKGNQEPLSDEEKADLAEIKEEFGELPFNDLGEDDLKSDSEKKKDEETEELLGDEEEAEEEIEEESEEPSEEEAEESEEDADLPAEEEEEELDAEESEDEEDAEEEDEEEEEQPSRRTVPYAKLKKAREQVKELRRQLAEQGENPAAIDQAVKEKRDAFRKKYNLPESFVADLEDAFGSPLKKAAQTAETLEIEAHNRHQLQMFDRDFMRNAVPLLREQGITSSKDLERLKAKVLDLKIQHPTTPIDWIIRGNPSLIPPKGKKTAETSRGGSMRDSARRVRPQKAEGEEITAEDINAMSDEEFDEWTDRQAGTTPTKIVRKNGSVYHSSPTAKK